MCVCVDGPRVQMELPGNTQSRRKRGELQAKAIDGFRLLQRMRTKLNFNTLTAVFIRQDGIDNKINSFLYQYTDGILVMV